MRYQIKFKITNRDCQAGHPQACAASWEETVSCEASCPETADAKAHEEIEKRYPGFIIECLECSENVSGEGGCNVYDPASLKEEDTTERKRS